MAAGFALLPSSALVPSLTCALIQAFEEWLEGLLVDDGRLSVFPPQGGPSVVQSCDL